MNRILLAAGALSALVALSACDSTESSDPATLTLSIDPQINGTALNAANPNALYTVGGVKTTVTGARLYLSEITLLKKDGTTVRLAGPTVTVPIRTTAGKDSTLTVSDRIVLVKSDKGETSYALGEAPAGDYAGMTYTVGLTGLANRADATQAPAGHALAKQTDLNNFWSWNAGYIFARFEGVLDLNHDGTPDADAASTWEMHLGTSAMATTVTSNTPFRLESGRHQELRVVADYGALMSGIDLSDASQRKCHTMDNVAVATKARANVSTAVAFRGVDSD